MKTSICIEAPRSTVRKGWRDIGLPDDSFHDYVDISHEENEHGEIEAIASINLNDWGKPWEFWKLLGKLISDAPNEISLRIYATDDFNTRVSVNLSGGDISDGVYIQVDEKKVSETLATRIEQASDILRTGFVRVNE